MTKLLFTALLAAALTACGSGKEDEANFLVLGDLHYDLVENHDLDWLATTDDDLRQVTTEYSVYTARYWADFTARLVRKAQSASVDAVLQLGDISEGLAGTPALARQMARSVFAAVDRIGFEVPVIIAKGNHDITGPGAREAFDEIYLPNMARLAGHDSLRSANYATRVGDALFVCYDPWDRDNHGLDALERNLRASDARYKFVMVHEPVIPVNERCWHLLRNDEARRERLLRIIARERAVVLCAHLHLYSVVRRDTQWGPIVQILVNSVVRDRDLVTPRKVIRAYGESLALDVPAWQPATLAERCAWLRAEAPHVKYFMQADLPGYGVLSIRKGDGRMVFRYYAAFGEQPFDEVDITSLLENR